MLNTKILSFSKSLTSTSIHFWNRRQRRNLTKEKICHFIKISMSISLSDICLTSVFLMLGYGLVGKIKTANQNKSCLSKKMI